MLYKLLVTVSIFLIAITSSAQETDNVETTYYFDTLLEYDEYHKKNKKHYKRFILLNSKDTIRERSVVVYDQKGVYNLEFNNYGFMMKTIVTEGFIAKKDSLVIKKETNTAFADSVIRTKNKPLLSTEIKSRYNIKKKISKVKASTNLTHKEKDFTINKTRLVFDHNYEMFSTASFTNYYKEIIEQNNNLTNGILIEKEYFDYYVQSKVKLKFISMQSVDIKITLKENSKRLLESIPFNELKVQ